MSPYRKELLNTMDEELRIPEKPESPEEPQEACVCCGAPVACICDL